MPERRIPKELEYPLYGANTLDSPEMLSTNQSLELVNAFPGKTIKPRNGCTEVYRIAGTDGEATGMEAYKLRAECVGYTHLGKQYIITWSYNPENTKHVAVVHNITDRSTQYLDVGSFDSSEVHVTFTKLYNSVYMFIERGYLSNDTNSDRTISKVLWVNDAGVWSVREMGFDIAPSVQSIYPVGTAAFGISGGVADYASVVFNNKMWAIGGINATGALSTVFSSADGSQWAAQALTAIELLWSEDGTPLLAEDGTQLYDEATFPTVYGAKAVVFDGRIWLVGGTQNGVLSAAIWSSADGASWTLYGKDAGFGARSDFGMVVKDDKIWVVGGDNGADLADVWTSVDGGNWTQVTQVAAITARSAHGLLSYNEKLWAIAGTGKTSVYSSTDGATWALVAADAGIGSRAAFGAAVYDSLMWVVGGLDGATAENSVYSSADGATWTLVQGSAEWSARYGAALFNHLDELYIVSGYTGAVYEEDAYHSNDGVTWAQTSSGLDPNVYYGYTFHFCRRVDGYAVLSGIAQFVYEPWETANGKLFVGVDERLLTGTVSLSSGALTGVGTAFDTELAEGDRIRLDGFPSYLEVTAIGSATGATVTNASGLAFSGVRFALLPADGAAVSTSAYQPGDCDGIEDLNMRRVVLANTTADFCRVFIDVLTSDAAMNKGATHVRIFRTLQGSSRTIAEGLAYRYLTDVALGRNTTYRDAKNDISLAGVTNEIEVIGKQQAPNGRFGFFAGGRMWVGGNPNKQGYWFASDTPSNTQYPQKYASIFDVENNFVACTPEDNQRDTGGFEFLGDAYFCKERRIFRLTAGNLNSVLTTVSYHIGVAFPNSVAFGVDIETGGPAVYFLSESGPAVLLPGGNVRLLTEFKEGALWPKKVGVLQTADGEETDWHTRNKVFGAFFNDAYWVLFGDSTDVDSMLGTATIVGCRYATDGSSYGPFSMDAGTIAEMKCAAVFDNATCYALSDKPYEGAWQHKVVKLLDGESFIDTFTEGAVRYAQQWSPRLYWCGPFRDSTALAKSIILPVRFGDTEALTVALTSDQGRFTIARVYIQQRQSGASNVGSAVYRRTVTLELPQGFYGANFKILISKTVPDSGDVEFFSPELVISDWNREPEFQDTMGAFEAITFVENANT